MKPFSNFWFFSCSKLHTTCLHPWLHATRFITFESFHEYLASMYVDLVYQLESLVYDIIRLCAQVFPFFWFILNFLCSFQISVKPNFDQHSNKFKTWKWKSKPGSFLVTPKWNFGEVFKISMLQIQNPFSSPLSSYDIVWDISP